MRGRERLALAALAAILAVTAAWWALALWPEPGAAPDWWARTRAVCFGAAPDGLPNAAGWLALVGQPALMIGALFVIAGQAVTDGLRALARAAAGRAVLAGAILMLASAGGLAARQIVTLGELAAAPAAAPDEDIPSTYPRLDRPAPPLRLVDQHGAVVGLDAFRGRPVVLTFAFAHCATICPLIVRDALAAQHRLADRRPVVLVVTLDPWRDTPARLPHIARAWRLGEDAFVLGGPVDDVEAMLDAWNVARARNPRTGDVTHPSLAYIIDPAGRIAYATTGGEAAIVELAHRALDHSTAGASGASLLP